MEEGWAGEMWEEEVTHTFDMRIYIKLCVYVCVCVYVYVCVCVYVCVWNGNSKCMFMP